MATIQEQYRKRLEQGGKADEGRQQSSESMRVGPPVTGTEKSIRAQYQRRREQGGLGTVAEQARRKYGAAPKATLDDIRENYRQWKSSQRSSKPVAGPQPATGMAAPGWEEGIAKAAGFDEIQRPEVALSDLDQLKQQAVAQNWAQKQAKEARKKTFGEPLEDLTIPEPQKVADLLSQAAETAAAGEEAEAEELTLGEKIAARPAAWGNAAQYSAANYALNALKALESADTLARPESIHPTRMQQMEKPHEERTAQLSEQLEADKQSGKISGLEAQIVDTAVRKVPDVLLSAMTAGGSTAAEGLSAMLQNPMFWTSFVQEYGGNYGELTQNGLSTRDAVLTALPPAAINAATEVQGGTEKLISDLVRNVGKQGAGALVKDTLVNAVEEALEEMLQAPVSNAMAKFSYDPEREVFNAAELLESAGYAFASSLILSGASYGAQSGLSTAAEKAAGALDNRALGQEIKRQDGGTGLLQAAMKSEDATIQRRASDIWQQAKAGQNPGPSVLGRLANDWVQSEQRQQAGAALPSGAVQAASQAYEAWQTGETAGEERVTLESLRDRISPTEEAEASGFTARERGRWGSRLAEIGRKPGQAEEAESPADAAGRQSTAPKAAVGQDTYQSPVREFAGSLGEHGEAAYLAAAEDAGQRGLDERRMRSAWTLYYNAGKWGKSLAWADGLDSAAASLVTGPQIAEQAFLAGQADAQQAQAAPAGMGLLEAGGALEGGVVSGTGAENIDQPTRLALDQLGRAFGYRFELTEMAVGNGSYNPETGVITLNTKSGGRTAILNVAKHEITHQMQDESPEAYRAFKNYVAAALYERDGQTFEALVQEQIDQTRSQLGRELSREMAEDEVVANATERFLTDEEAVGRLMEKDQSLGEKILGILKEVVKKIRQALGGQELSQEASRLLAEDLDTLQEAEAMWTRMLLEKKKAQQKAAPQEKGAAKEQRRYQLNPDFGRQIDAWDKKSTGGYFMLGATSEALQSIGIEEKKIYWDKSKIKKILREHPEMTVEVIKQVPELLEHPVVVMQSQTVANRVVLLGEVKADNGETVLAALELRPKGGRTAVVDFVKMTSAYGKSLRGLQHLLDTSDILYLDPDKKRTDSWLEARRLQLPVGLTSYGSIASVTYTARDVKGELSFGEEGGKTAMALAFEEAAKKEGERGQDRRRYQLETEPSSQADFKSGRMTEDERQTRIHAVAELQPVADLRGDEFSIPSPNLLGQLTSYFSSIGGQAESPYIGTVSIQKKGIKASLAHGIGPEKAAAFHAVPDIIRKGIPVDFQYNWKGREYDTVVLAAPVTIDGDGYMMAVVVKQLRDRRNTFYLHDVEIEKRTPDAVQTAPAVSSETDPVRSGHQGFSIQSLLREILSVKSQKSQDALRYQLAEGGQAKLVLENERLARAVANLKQEFKLTHGAHVRARDVEQLAKRTLKRVQSSFETTQLSERLEAVFEYMANDPEPNGETAFGLLTDTARAVLEKSEYLDRSLWEETREIRAQIRQTALYVSEKERADFAAADGYEAFRRANFGKFTLTNNRSAQSVDQLYSTLSRDYPGWFEGNAASAYDQLCEINDFLEAAKPRLENPYGENLEQQAAQLAGELFDAYFDLPQIKTYADRQKQKLDQLRRQHRAEMAALRQEQRDRYEQKLKAVKEAARGREKRLQYEKWWGVQAEKLAAREAREALRDRRAVLESRRRIERKVKSLGSALLNPTDSRNIPEGLRSAVQAVIGSLDMTSSRGADTQVSVNWAALQSAVAAARTDERTDTTAILDPDLEERIGQLQESGVTLNTMTRAQAEEVYKVFAALERACRGVKIQLAENRQLAASQAAQQVVTELRELKRRPSSRIAGRKIEGFGFDLTDPTRFSEMFGKTLGEALHQLREGHDLQTIHWEEAVRAARELFGKAKVWKWQQQKPAVFQLSEGEIALTPTQVMSLYLLNQREQARSHLYGQGITVPESRLGTRILPERHLRVTPEEVAKILESLTDEQKRIADGLGQFVSKQAASWGNEVSMALYGYKKFTEEHYWPISSDPNYTFSQMDGEVRDGTLAGMGMTKQTRKGANNPILLDDAITVFSRHVTQMAAYSAYLPRLEAFKALYSWKGSRDGTLPSVKEALERVGGKAAKTYLENLILDINGGGRLDRSPSEKLMGWMKAGSIAGNIRVVVQQPTAYLRAAAVMNPKYLAEGLIRKGNAEEMKRYAPIARWKDWGYFEAGNGKQLEQLMVGSHGTLDTLTELSMWGAGAMDNLTWGRIWAACKAEIADTTDLSPESEAFLQAAGRRFSEVIDKTQVVDSIFHRTQMMRSKNALTKMATAFMGEPLKSLNLFMSAVRQAGEAKGMKAKLQAGGRIVRTTLAFCATAAVNALVVSFVDAARDDDDDETYWEKYRQALWGDFSGDLNAIGRMQAFLGGNMVDNLNPLSMIPLVKDALSLLEGYDVERMDMQGISGLVDTALMWARLGMKDSKYTIPYLIRETAQSLSKCFGLPVANIIRDLGSLINLSLTVADTYQLADTSRIRYALDRWNLDIQSSKNKSTFVRHLFLARQSGDFGLATQIYNDLVESGYTGDQLDRAMAAFAQKLLKGRPEIAAYRAAVDAADAESVSEITEALMAEGFTADEIIKAARTADDGDEEEEEAPGEPIEVEFWQGYGGEEQAFDVSFLTDAILSGKQASIQAANQELLDSGKQQKQIDSSVVSELKKRLANEMGYEKLKDIPDGVFFDTSSPAYKVIHDQYGLTQYSIADAADALVSGKTSTYNKIRQDMLGHSTQIGGKEIDEESFTDGLQSQLKKRLVTRAGYETAKEMTEAGEYLDITSKEYKILHDTYQWTQFSYTDVAKAYAGLVSYNWKLMAEDMAGQTRGSTSYPAHMDAEKLQKEIRSSLLSLYKEGRYAGKLTQSELKKTANALQRLGVSSSQLEKKYGDYVEKKEEKK